MREEGVRELWERRGARSRAEVERESKNEWVTRVEWMDGTGEERECVRESESVKVLLSVRYRVR